MTDAQRHGAHSVAAGKPAPVPALKPPEWSRAPVQVAVPRAYAVRRYLEAMHSRA